MTQNLVFIGFTLASLMALVMTAHLHPKVGFKSVFGLFIFGMLISIPFVLVEHFGVNLNYLNIVIAFLIIELAVLFFEHHVHYFHQLIHHNIKDLRIISFILIGFGFTYSEIGLTILYNATDMIEMVNTIPFKTTYAILMHTVFASAASLVGVGAFVARGLYTTFFRALSYYIRISIISFSHFLYVYSVEHNLMLLIALLLVIGVASFFYIKKRLDLRPEAIE